jgi:hypothetical protein
VADLPAAICKETLDDEPRVFAASDAGVVRTRADDLAAAMRSEAQEPGSTVFAEKR